jgi:hypothetical protein
VTTPCSCSSAEGRGDPSGPEAWRRIPHERAWSVSFRTLHLMGFGVLVGGHVWGVAPERLVPALAVTAGAGAALAGLELYRSFGWLLQVKGLFVQAKLVALLAVPVFWNMRGALLLGVVALASVGAHLPARYRNYSVWHRRVIGTVVTPQLTLSKGGLR